ncbi:MAG: patatin [Gammaproteobacteria bacterium CG22_combo_CG10-13_8_21_14_all_40_8]|nr:MAG: patatin [Gammaproteobacteria bacterium CG22_combo_CG10-13_8_21_14_all_40_8]
MAWFDKETNRSKIGLVLTGGGAKAAYQVGVLKAIIELTPQDHPFPFQVISGSSAGAINATVLACYANRYRVGMRQLENVWSHFHAHHIYLVGWAGLMANTLRWASEFLRSPHQSPRPLSLLMNSPLKKLLTNTVQFDNIQQNIHNGTLDGLSITAYSYQQRMSVSFYQSEENVQNWTRHKRRGERHNLHINHLMASSAIPMVFPAVKINRDYYGDGSVGCLSPLSPALHLGAEKLLIISTDPIKHKQLHHANINYPTMAEIAGNLMDSIFTDSLASDLERLNRINETLETIPSGRLKRNKSYLKPINSLLIAPEFDIDEIAGEHFCSLPKLLKFFLNRMGICANHGGNILSYLLFESSFTQVLIQKGYEDGLKQADTIKAFIEVS